LKLALPLILLYATLAVADGTVEIEAALEGDCVRGTLTATLEGAKDGELRLYLPANRDRDPTFVGPVEEMNLFADNVRGAYPFEGRTEVTRLAVNGEETSDFTVEGVGLRVWPVAEGPLEITLDFTTRIPAFRHLWGRTDDLIVLSGWHPRPWPVGGNGEYLDVVELPWGVFPGRPSDYEVELQPPAGWEPLGAAAPVGNGAFSAHRTMCDGVDLVLVKDGEHTLSEEVWGGLSVGLVDLTGDGTGAERLHFAREVYDRYADWFSPLEGNLTVVAADVPLSGEEYYEDLVLLGDIASYPLLRLPELAYARQMAGLWLRTDAETRGCTIPFLMDGIAHWAAREALVSVYGEGRDLLPVDVLGFDQEWLARTLVEDLRQSGRDRPAAARADAFDQPETYDAAVRQKTAQAMLRWSRRWSRKGLLDAVALYIDRAKTESPTLKLFFECLGESAGFSQAAELTNSLVLGVPGVTLDPANTTPKEPEEPGFEFRILPDALDPEAWTLFLVPFPWPDYDDTWRLGAALWGREGVHLLPMEIWGDDDVLLSATYSFEHEDWNLLAQYTTRLNGWHPGLRLGVAGYSRKDEQGGSVQFTVPLRPRLSHPPEFEFTTGLNFCRLRSWDTGDRPLRLRGEDGRQLSVYGSFSLNARGVLGGPQLLLVAEYAFDPAPRLNPEHPPIDYGRFYLRAQEDLRITPWLWVLFRGALGHVEGYAPAQRRFELTEDDVSLEYDLIRLPQAGNIRGYNDLDLYADDMAVLGVELFAPVFAGIELGLFYDRGAAADGLRSLAGGENPWRSSFGPLLRYRVGDTIYLEFNFPLWVSDPYTADAEPGGPEWAFRWDFDARIGF
jgi:hypothetical protein